MIWTPWITYNNVENAAKSKRTGKAEILKVVPNEEFQFKHNSKTDNQNALLFEELNPNIFLFFTLNYLFSGLQKFSCKN